MGKILKIKKKIDKNTEIVCNYKRKIILITQIFFPSLIKQKLLKINQISQFKPETTSNLRIKIKFYQTKSQTIKHF